MEEFYEKIFPENRRLETSEGLTLEFMSTVRVNKIGEFPTSMSFCLGGERRAMTTAIVNQALGTPRRADRGNFMKKSRYDATSFWESITNGGLTPVPVYGLRHAKASFIRNPAIRYVEKILSQTLFARSEGGAINTDELYCLWCFQKKVKFDCGAMLMLTIEKLQIRPCAQLRIGGMIALLAQHLGIRIPNPLEGRDMDVERLKKTLIITTKKGVFYYKLHDGTLFPIPN